jgi:hypothetical protein
VGSTGNVVSYRSVGRRFLCGRVGLRRWGSCRVRGSPALVRVRGSPPIVILPGAWVAGSGAGAWVSADSDPAGCVGRRLLCGYVGLRRYFVRVRWSPAPVGLRVRGSSAALGSSFTPGVIVCVWMVAAPFHGWENDRSVERDNRLRGENLHKLATISILLSSQFASESDPPSSPRRPRCTIKQKRAQATDNGRASTINRMTTAETDR